MIEHHWTGDTNGEDYCLQCGVAKSQMREHQLCPLPDETDESLSVGDSDELVTGNQLVYDDDGNLLSSQSGVDSDS